MGLIYTHLSLHERQLMYKWHYHQTTSIREIARRLNRSHSTISRELKRNTSTHYVPTWYPHPAQTMYEQRVKRRGQRAPLKDKSTLEFVKEKLKLGWTPEIISGRLKQQATLKFTSHESIYQFIYKRAPELIACLPRQHKRRKKKYPTRKSGTKINEKVSILERPEEVNDRSDIGHWESDSIVSPEQKAGCNVLIERVTRLVHISKLASKNAEETVRAIKNKLGQHPPEFVKSITYDNGSENAKHLEINNHFKSKSFFCQAYHSWEKGSVEQVNSLIRRFLPKKTDITKISEAKLLEIEHLINTRPRKCLHYQTPLEVYLSLFASAGPKST